MNKNPYGKEIVGIFTLGPVLLVGETWRRWDNLLRYNYFDDVWLVLLAFVSAYYLLKRRFIGQLLWLFTCGAAFCMIYFSFFSSLEAINGTDPSGLEMFRVVLVKAGMYLIVLTMSFRSIKLVLGHRFEVH